MLPLWMLLFLFTKHLFADFIYQPPYQWKNKGIYGHLGGIVHSGQHILASALLLFYLAPTQYELIAALLAGEFVVHYHMDWLKMNLSRIYNLMPIPTSNCDVKHSTKFWQLTGIDQYVHALTYLAMVAAWIYFMGPQ